MTGVTIATGGGMRVAGTVATALKRVTMVTTIMNGTLSHTMLQAPSTKERRSAIDQDSILTITLKVVVTVEGQGLALKVEQDIRIPIVLES